MPWPKLGTKLHKIARFFVGTVDHYGIVDIRGLRGAGLELTSTALAPSLASLRGKYKYFARPSGRPHLYFAAKSWPTFSYEGDRKIYKFDERLAIVTPAITKYRGDPQPGTDIFDIWTYIKNNREPHTFIVDLTAIHKKFGSKQVHRKMKVLKDFYGFTFDKAEANNCYVVHKLRNDVLIKAKIAKPDNAQLQPAITPPEWSHDQ